MNIVNVLWDDEEQVYIAICDSLGITLESDSYDELISKVIETAPEMAALKNVECASLMFHTDSWKYDYASDSGK